MSSNAFQFFGVPTLLGRGLQPSDAIDGQDPQPVVVLGYKFWQRHLQRRNPHRRRPHHRAHPQALHHHRRRPGALHLAGRRCLCPAQNHPGSRRRLRQRNPPKAGNHPAHGRTGAPATLHRVRKKRPPNTSPPNPARSTSRASTNASSREIGRHPGSALRRGRPPARHRLPAMSPFCFSPAARHASTNSPSVPPLEHPAVRIVRQLLTESLLLSITGAALGVIVAYKLLALIVTLLPQNSFPHEAAIGINVPVLVFSVLVALATGIFFGLSAGAASLPSRRPRGHAGGHPQGHRHQRRPLALERPHRRPDRPYAAHEWPARGRPIQGFLKLAHKPLGYDPHNVMSVEIPVHQNTHTTIEERSAFFEQLRNKIAQTPGVKLAAISSNATPPSNGSNRVMEILGKPASTDQKGPHQSRQSGLLSGPRNPAHQWPPLVRDREPQRRERSSS